MTQENQRPAEASGVFRIGGDLPVNRLGYGAMQLTGPGVWGEPKDPDEAVRVLRRAVELGVNFIDTADSYGPFVSEQLIRKALHPYPTDLVIATKAGLSRSGPGDWAAPGPARLPAAADRTEPAPPRRRAHRPLPSGAPALVRRTASLTCSGEGRTIDQ